MFTTGLKKNKMIAKEGDNFEIWQIGSENAYMITRLLAQNYYQSGWITYLEELEKMYLEDQRYAPYGIFVAIRDSIEKDILGTFRMTLKADQVSFILEKDFGIDLKQLCHSLPSPPQEIWHCGRISVDKEKLLQLGYSKKDSFLLLKIMMKCMYRIAGKDLSNIMLGENLATTQRLYSMMGFPMRVLAEKEYFSGVRVYASYMRATDLPSHSWVIN